MIYVYGVIPADVDLDPAVRGVGDPPRRVESVPYDGVAALVSEIPETAALSAPEALTAHARIVDGAAADVPVLPMRFGAVLPDRDAVVGELLAPHAPRFAASLRELEGRVQYVVTSRYSEDSVCSARSWPEIRGRGGCATAWRACPSRRPAASASPSAS